jgi:parvulin-like peptidyl-prolyl isomerase
MRLESGDDFGELARNFSQGPNSDKGGDCGYFKAGELLEELDRAAFSLPIGEVSPVIKTSVGYHLIKVTERGEGEAKSIDSVRDEIRQILSRELFQTELKKWVDSLKETAYISRRL